MVARIKELQAEIERLDAARDAQPRNWGIVGDMNYIADILGRLTEKED